MARNEEKHYGRLNRLYLFKEKEEYEKKYPKRPRLDTLETHEEVQMWLPSIKRDIDFYLKKSQVTCYSDAHVEDCREKVVKLEKEFKAFVRKIKQLSPSPVDAIPWTSRPYKRKKPDIVSEELCDGFRLINTPILDNHTSNLSKISPQDAGVNLALMDVPLNFSSEVRNRQNIYECNYLQSETNLVFNSCDGSECSTGVTSERRKSNCKISAEDKIHENKFTINIVNYDTSSEESS